MPPSPIRKIRTASANKERRSSLVVQGNNIPLRPKSAENQQYGGSEQQEGFWPQMDAQQMLAAYINQQMEGQSPMAGQGGGQTYSPMAVGYVDWGAMARQPSDMASPGRIRELNSMLPLPAFAMTRPDDYDPTTPCSIANSPTAASMMHTRNPFGMFWGQQATGGLGHAGSGIPYYPGQQLSSYGSGIPHHHDQQQQQGPGSPHSQGTASGSGGQRSSLQRGVSYVPPGMYRMPSGVPPGGLSGDGSSCGTPTGRGQLHHAASGVPAGMYRAPSMMAPPQWVLPAACYAPTAAAAGGAGYACYPPGGLQHAYSGMHPQYGFPAGGPMSRAGSRVPGGLYHSHSGVPGAPGAMPHPQPPPPPPPAGAGRQGHPGGGRLPRGKSGLYKMASGMPEGGLSDPEYQQQQQQQHPPPPPPPPPRMGSTAGMAPGTGAASGQSSDAAIDSGAPGATRSPTPGREGEAAPPTEKKQRQRVRICMPAAQPATGGPVAYSPTSSTAEGADGAGSAGVGRGAPSRHQAEAAAASGGDADEQAGPMTLEEAWSARSGQGSGRQGAATSSSSNSGGGQSHPSSGGAAPSQAPSGWVPPRPIHTAMSGVQYVAPHLMHAYSGMSSGSPMSPAVYSPGHMGWHPAHLMHVQSGMPPAAVMAAVAAPWQVQQVQHLAQQGLWRQQSAAASPRHSGTPQRHQHPQGPAHHFQQQQQQQAGMWRQGSGMDMQHGGSSGAAASPRAPYHHNNQPQQQQQQQQGVSRQKSAAAALMAHHHGGSPLGRQGSSPLGAGQHKQQQPHSSSGTGGGRDSPLARSSSSWGPEQQGVWRQGSSNSSHHQPPHPHAAGSRLWKHGSQSPASPRSGTQSPVSQSSHSGTPRKERPRKGGGVRFAEQPELLRTRSSGLAGSGKHSPDSSLGRATPGSGEAPTEYENYVDYSGYVDYGTYDSSKYAPGAAEAGEGEAAGADGSAVDAYSSWLHISAQPAGSSAGDSWPGAAQVGGLPAAQQVQAQGSWGSEAAAGAGLERGMSGLSHVKVVPRPAGVQVPRRPGQFSSTGGGSSQNSSSGGGHRSRGSSSAGHRSSGGGPSSPRSHLGGRPGSGGDWGGSNQGGGHLHQSKQGRGGSAGSPSHHPNSNRQGSGSRLGHGGGSSNWGAAAAGADAGWGTGAHQQQGPLIPHKRSPSPASSPLVPHKAGIQLPLAATGANTAAAGGAATGRKFSSAGASRCSSAASSAMAQGLGSRCASPGGVMLPPLRTPSPACVGGGGGILSAAAGVGQGAAGRLRPGSAGVPQGRGGGAAAEGRGSSAGSPMDLTVNAKGVGLVRSASSGSLGVSMASGGKLQPTGLQGPRGLGGAGIKAGVCGSGAGSRAGSAGSVGRPSSSRC